MLKRSLLLLPLVPAFALGGCTGTVNRGLESVHQPVVSRADYAYDFGATPQGLAPGEAQRLAGWLSAMRLGYGDRVAIDDPADHRAARDDVAGEVARYGLLLSDDTPVTRAPVAPGTVRVVVTRMQAYVPGCPDYTRPTQPEFESNTTSNQGCAINSNLAAMVANPADLVRGETGASVSDTALATRAVNAYRAAAPSGGGGTVVKAESSGGK